MSYFYTKNDDLIKSPLNKSFGELFTCTEEDFAIWVDELCFAVTLQWDEFGQPPKAGVRLEEMGSEFERICKVDTDKTNLKNFSNLVSLSLMVYFVWVQAHDMSS